MVAASAPIVNAASLAKLRAARFEDAQNNEHTAASIYDDVGGFEFDHMVPRLAVTLDPIDGDALRRQSVSKLTKPRA